MGNLTDNYLNRLPSYELNAKFLAHDGDPCHYTREVNQILKAIVGDRWRGPNNHFQCPSRSPEMTPVEFSL